MVKYFKKKQTSYAANVSERDASATKKNKFTKEEIIIEACLDLVLPEKLLPQSWLLSKGMLQDLSLTQGYFWSLNSMEES